MADPSAQREVIPQNQTTNLSFNAAPSLTLASNHPPPRHYSPQVFLDPVAAAAFYQRQYPAHQPHVSAHQPHVSQPLTSNPAHTQVSQPHQISVNPPHNPYYIPDMAAVALQQFQLQTMLQLQAQNNPHLNPPSRHDTQTSQQHQPIVPHHTTATSQSSVPGILPVPPHITRALTVNSSLIPPSLAIPSATIPHSATLPIVPEAQMASAYRIGRYTPAERKIRLERYREKRRQRNYNRRVKYNCRKQIADKRRRVQGRFVKREEEMALAASETVNGDANGTSDQHRNSEATDATEDETKVQHPESSGSGSSTRHMTVNVGGSSTNDGVTGEQQSFCDQSDQILQTFR